MTTSDDILDRIDAIVRPGTDVGQLDMAYNRPGREADTEATPDRPTDRRVGQIESGLRGACRTHTARGVISGSSDRWQRGLSRGKLPPRGRIED
jgi:hypothetical protein